MTTPAIADALKAARHYPWSPTTWPYRVHFTRGGTYYTRFVSDAYTFATVDEAREFAALVAAPMFKGCKVHVMRADLGASGEWAKTGRWVDAA